jgi:hypothetical protein
LSFWRALPLSLGSKVDKFVAGFHSRVREFFQVPPPAIVS